MKKFTSILIILSITAFLSCTRQSAADYSNSIILEQQAIVNKIDALKKSINDYYSSSPDTALNLIDAAFDSAVFQIDSGLYFIGKLNNFKNDSSLKNGALELFESYKNVIEKNYSKLIALYKIPETLFSTDDQIEIDSLIEAGNIKFNESFQNFTKIHEEFAKNNNLIIE